MTTAEQTLLDLVVRPDLGEVPDSAREAIDVLLPRVDTALLRELARPQHRRRAVDALLSAHGQEPPPC